MDQHIKISSNIRNICDVENFLNSLFKELKFSRKIYCKIYLAVNEAVNNAVIHGNGENPKKIVFVDFNENQNFYRFTVSDEGNGFDFNNIQNPVSSENIHKESGRGIFIIKQYADKVKFYKKGTQIEMIFNK